MRRLLAPLIPSAAPKDPDEIESLKLEQTLLEQRIVLQTLIGSDIPTRPPDRPAVQ